MILNRTEWPSGESKVSIDMLNSIEQLKKTFRSYLAKAPDGPVSIMVTPEFARWILDTYNISNRKLNKAKKKILVKAMKAGQWSWKASGNILISTRPRIIDGQHRLMAIAESGIDTMMFFLFGANDGDYDKVDQHAPRGAGDVLTLGEYDQPIAFAAALRWIVNYQNGTLSKRERIAPLDIKAIAAVNTDVQSHIEQSNRIYGKHSLLQPSIVCAVMTIVTRENASLAEEFIDLLEASEDHWNEVGGPARPFKSITKELVSRKSEGLSTYEHIKIGMLLKAWSFYKDKKRAGGAKDFEYKVIKDEVEVSDAARLSELAKLRREARKAPALSEEARALI
jgi:hypothetical protein